MSPTRNMRQGWPSLWQITAFLENSKVWVLFFGLESFANTMPTMNACRITPVIDCMHITKIASGHSSVVCFEPYLRKQNDLSDGEFILKSEHFCDHRQCSSLNKPHFLFGSNSFRSLNFFRTLNIFPFIENSVFFF